MVSERKSNKELKAVRLSCLAHVQLGVVYRHKKSGAYYIPKEVAVSEVDLCPVVVYSPLSDSGVVWTRPFDDWRAKFERQLR